MEEIWKEMPNYEGLYMISNIGNVKSITFKKERILKPYLRPDGYLEVYLYKNNIKTNFRIHILVGLVFLDHKINKDNPFDKVINHINLIKTDNRSVNLEITSVRENTNMLHIKSYSKFRGVTFIKNTKYFKSTIFINNTHVFLKQSTDEKYCACMYNIALHNIDKFNGNKKEFKSIIEKELIRRLEKDGVNLSDIAVDYQPMEK